MAAKTLAMTESAETARAHVAAFDGLAAALPGAGLDWLGALRSEALARFAAGGIPTRRLEDWKFTGLDPLVRSAFAPGAEAASGTADVPRGTLDALAPGEFAARLVFVDGAYRPDLSEAAEMPGVTILPLSQALSAHGQAIAPILSTGDQGAQALIALNAAFMAGGAYVALADGTEIERPVALLFLSAGGDGAARHLRNVVALGPGARARLVEIHAGLDGSGGGVFDNAVTDIALAPDSRLDHLRIQAEGPETLHHSHSAVRIGRGAAYASFTLSTGADISRQETAATFAAPGGRCRLLGAYLGRRRQHMDHTTRVHHAHPHCTTEEVFKGVLDDRAHGVFQGLIRVAPHAVKTDAHQKNQNLLLSDRAVADAKPELEILADDVRCSHGATVGDLDADELFYMAARGIAPAEARRLLVAGFIDDLVARMEDEGLARLLRTHTNRWLAEE